MKKFKFISVVALIFMSSVFMFSGCKKTLLMDEEKCAEVALEYMENKYQEEFEVLDSGEVGKFIGKAGYAEVKVRNKSENTENKYFVVVYPDGSDDKDDDGYYDRYKVISDTYMCYLLNDCVKKEMDKLLLEAELTNFISSVSIEEGVDMEGFWGFSNGFFVQTEDFSVTEILDNYRISIHCWIKIPESENCEVLQDEITNVMKPLISNDLITFSIEVYDNVTYKEIEELREKGTGYNSRGIERISFSVKEEEDNEYRK